MKNNVYIVNTEYHLILTLGIIQQYFSKDCNNIIVRVSPIGGSRLNNLNFQDTGLEYHEIIYDYLKPSSDLKEELQYIVSLKPDKLFFFLENKFWLNYLFSKLRKTGTTIILAPDGMKAYAKKNHLTTRQRTRMFIEGLKNSMKAGLFSTLPFVENNYASSKYIDEVWVEYPQYYNNITRKKVVEFHYTIDGRFVNFLMKVFNVEDIDFEIIRKEPVVLFLDSSYKTKEYYDRTLNILDCLNGQYPNRKLLVKYHPLSAKEAKIAFSSIQSIIEVNSSYPAELYLALAKDAIVVSMVSTSELFHNPCCNYYWIYKLYSDMYDYESLQNPTNYIKVVSEVNQIGK